MLEGGEDPRFIARRMVILASEDIGNADPQALVVATAAGRAVDRVGMPECALNLAQAADLPGAGAEVERLLPGRSAPPWPRSASRAPSRRPTTCATRTIPGASKLGRGIGYVYPARRAGRGWPSSPLMPEGLEGRRFYEPTDRGFEAELRRRLEQIRRRRSAEGRAEPRRNFRGATSQP